jgi:hypothetical protein
MLEEFNVISGKTVICLKTKEVVSKGFLNAEILKEGAEFRRGIMLISIPIAIGTLRSLAIFFAVLCACLPVGRVNGFHLLRQSP